MAQTSERIVFWNIRAGGGSRVDRIVGALQGWRPNVVALSEFRATPPSLRLAELLGETGLPHQLTTADARRPAANRLLLACDRPLRRVRLRNAPREPGQWLLAQVAAERPYTLGVMHVPNQVTGCKYAYHDAVLDVVGRWRRGPALLLGDTNSGRIGLDEEAPVFGRREDDWIAALERLRWRDSFRYLHGEARAYTWYSPNGRNGFRLDEAFVNRALLPRLQATRYEWALADHRSGRRDAVSDHAALIVELEA
jgi:exodeoxyribonuclease-3